MSSDNTFYYCPFVTFILFTVITAENSDVEFVGLFAGLYKQVTGNVRDKPEPKNVALRDVLVVFALVCIVARLMHRKYSKQ